MSRQNRRSSLTFRSFSRPVLGTYEGGRVHRIKDGPIMLVAATAQNSAADPLAVSLKVEGMTCGHCEAAVRTALEAVEATDNVANVSKEDGIATLVVHADVSRPDVVQELISAVKRAGFAATVLSSA
jgi:copper chaperone